MSLLPSSIPFPCKNNCSGSILDRVLTTDTYSFCIAQKQSRSIADFLEQGDKTKGGGPAIEDIFQISGFKDLIVYLDLKLCRSDEDDVFG
jgi:hypothetical protein